METFADYILGEKELVSKMEIVYYLSKKTGIYFDKSVLFKTEILRQFIEYMKIDIDKNMIITASLLCNCKKVNNAQKLGLLKSYALEGALYLSELGFNKRFCKICEEVNRYSESNPRERESDILELADQFGGMLLSRPERIGMNAEEAVVLLEHRNLKDVYNRYLGTFLEYVEEMEGIELEGSTKITPFKKLVKIESETPDLKKFIKKLAYEYSPEVDKKMIIVRSDAIKTMLNVDKSNPNRALFSSETTKKILKNIEDTAMKIDE